jgi:hypothetical protein
MLARGITAGISMLCAFLLLSSAAQGASGFPAENTTAVTCVSKGGAEDFNDAHCDSKTGGFGKFGHVAIKTGEATSVALTNAKTQNNTLEASPAILKGTIFGVKTEIVCKTVSGEGTLTNEEPVPKLHRFKASLKTKLNSCTVAKPAGFGCKVKEIIELGSTVEGVEHLAGGIGEMGLEFRPTAVNFDSITIEGCFLAGTFPLGGTAVATGAPLATEKHSGATLIFTNAMTKETLKFGGNPAEFSSSTTLTMASGGNPIAFTTTT